MRTPARSTSDLIAVLVLSLLYLTVVLAVPGGVLRGLLGLPFLLVLPGYALLAALYHDSVTLELSERLAVSCALSLAAVVLVATMLNVFHRLDQMELSIGLEAIIAASCVYAHRRRNATRTHDADPLVLRNWGWDGRSVFEALVGIVVAVCFSAALYLAADLAASEPAPRPAAVFYLLGDDGKAGHYVRALECGSSFPVTLGVINDIEGVRDYSIFVRMGDRRPRLLTQITVDPGQTWEEQFQVTVEQCGVEEYLRFDLLDGQSEPPYRSVYQRIRVTAR